jgi:hypothetical protein
MSQLSDIRNAVADRIKASGIDSSVAVFAYPPRDFPLPAAIILPADGTYHEYHGTFGDLRLQEVRLIVRIIVPEGGSPQSAGELMDEFLSSGSAESSSLADAITGTATVGDATADLFADRAENWTMGDMVRSQTTPVVSCDIPVRVALKRS